LLIAGSLPLQPFGFKPTPVSGASFRGGAAAPPFFDFSGEVIDEFIYKTAEKATHESEE
tara:strand:- start:1106 stop:1282 length:177 start_codon:yes stop_codon:yes gene_type:complete